MHQIKCFKILKKLTIAISSISIGDRLAITQLLNVMAFI